MSAARAVAGGAARAGKPLVSVVMPCLNEARFIVQALDSLLGDPGAPVMEVLVVDGASEDGTREAVQAIAERDGRVRLLDNPRRSTPAGLNVGIRAARGAIVVRADAHSEYPPGYVSELLRALDETGAEMVGGCLEHLPSGEGAIARALAVALGSAFGTGSRLHFDHAEGPADCLPFGAWRREVFDRFGLFDERLLRNQDNEHSSRIAREGGALWRTSSVCVRYRVRPTLRALCAQGRSNGMWNAFTQRLHPHSFRWRHALPGLFFAGVVLALLSIVAGAVSGRGWLALVGGVMLAPYLAINLVTSFKSAIARREPELAWLLPPIFFAYHFAYGFGIAEGWSLVASGRWRRRLGRGEAPLAAAVRTG